MLGVCSAMSSKVSIRFRPICSAVIAVIAIGVSCKFDSRFCAVTTISSISVAAANTTGEMPAQSPNATRHADACAIHRFTVVVPLMSVQNPIGTDTVRHFTPRIRTETACYKTQSCYAISRSSACDRVISHVDAPKCHEILHVHRFVPERTERMAESRTGCLMDKWTSQEGSSHEALLLHWR